MNEKNKISLTEIDRENWRYILYESEDKNLYCNFVYSSQNFIDLSVLIKLNSIEEQIYRDGRIEFLDLADKVRFNHKEYINRQIDHSTLKITNRPNYFIVSIDLDEQESIEQLHSTFKSILKFPKFYGMNWDAFWDAITGLTKMPSNLILYNLKSLNDRFNDSAKTISRIKMDFNKIDPNEQIHFDYKDEVKSIKEVKEISSIFKTRPFQYGLRGDQPLWDELEEEFKAIKIPNTEDELTTNLHCTIEKLTGDKLLIKDKIFVERYNKGGMSGGVVSSKFWLKKGIPILISRFREMKKVGNKVHGDHAR